MELSTLQTLNLARASRRAAIVVGDLSDGSSQAFVEGDRIPPNGPRPSPKRCTRAGPVF